HSRLYGCCCLFSSRRRHTRSKRDWSSDVCSSDLKRIINATIILPTIGGIYEPIVLFILSKINVIKTKPFKNGISNVDIKILSPKIGRASCRERVKIKVVGRELKN